MVTHESNYCYPCYQHCKKLTFGSELQSSHETQQHFGMGISLPPMNPSEVAVLTSCIRSLIEFTANV